MITIGYNTRKTNPEFQEYLRKSSGIHKVEVIEVVNNGEKSLPVVYNEILKQSSNDIVVLCHDDIYFDTKNWGKKIISHFNDSDFGIIGVAGTTDIPKSGMWWEDKTKMVGIVNHEHEGRKWESKYCNNFNNSIQEVSLIDGLFISLKKDRIKKTFNEDVEGFHFYDVYFSVENYLEDVKIGVIYDVRITHKSIGMTNEKWESNRVIFSEKFSEELPINLRPEINYNFIDSKSKEKYQLVLQSTTTENTKNFIKSLNDIGCENVEIIIISNGENTEDLKEINGHIIVEGYFDSISKNISVLKWDNEFSSKLGDVLFMSTDRIVLKNNVFYSLYKILKKEIHSFGCAFPTTLSNDLTIFSSGLSLFINNETKLIVSLNNQNKIYDLFQGNKKSIFGNISGLVLTTKKNLNLIDWFDINMDTEFTFTDLSFKLSRKNLNSFVDTNSIIQLNTDVDFEKINSELQSSISNNAQDEKFLSNIKKIKTMKKFKHSGQSGDLIISLSAIKSYNEPSSLYVNLGMKANLYPGAKNPLGDVLMNQKMFEFMEPLLSHQDYLTNVSIYQNQSIDVDLDQFRTLPLSPAMGSLIKRYFLFVHNFIDLTEPWITCGEKIDSLSDKILVCRSERYRNPNINYAFLNTLDNVVFCGLDDEWEDFRKWVRKSERIIANNALELANYINSCKLFIGNQSMPYAIAEALKVNRLLEVNLFAYNNISAGGKCNEFLNQEGFQNFVKLYNK